MNSPPHLKNVPTALRGDGTIMLSIPVPVKFEVIVSPPKYITDWDKCQHVYIKARWVRV